MIECVRIPFDSFPSRFIWRLGMNEMWRLIMNTMITIIIICLHLLRMSLSACWVTCCARLWKRMCAVWYRRQQLAGLPKSSSSAAVWHCASVRPSVRPSRNAPTTNKKRKEHGNAAVSFDRRYHTSAVEQDLGDRDYFFYQFNGVVVEEFVGSELRPIGIGQLIPQRLAVQFLTLAQALIETLVKHPHHLSKKNKKKKRTKRMSTSVNPDRQSPPPNRSGWTRSGRQRDRIGGGMEQSGWRKWITCLTEVDECSLSACSSSLERLNADESSWRARMLSTSCSALRCISDSAGLVLLPLLALLPPSPAFKKDVSDPSPWRSSSIKQLPQGEDGALEGERE